MCTTAAKKTKDTWFLMKTRDPVTWMRWEDEIKLYEQGDVDAVSKYIIENPNPNEDGYYGGMNAHGVAFTSTFVRTHPLQVSYIRKPYVRLILEAKTAKEAVGIINDFNPKIGGNMFVADAKECYGIEGDPRENFVEKIEKYDVKVNHYTHLPYKNISFDTIEGFEDWSYQHLDRATELVKTVQTVEDAKNLLKDRKHSDKKQAICTTSAEEDCYTYSAFVFDTKNKRVYYAQGNPLENGFVEYGF